MSDPVRTAAIALVAPDCAIVDKEVRIPFTSHGAAVGALYALRRALDLPVEQPAGWALVPIEPTDDMLIAGQEAWTRTRRNRPALEDCKEAEAAYRAMLAASPTEPADQPKELKP